MSGGQQRAVRSRRWRLAGRAIVLGLISGFLFDAAGLRDEASVMAVTLPAASHSSTIALNRQDRQLWVVNREANSVSVIQVRDRTTSRTPPSSWPKFPLASSRAAW
jgi:hypothetical protein